MRVPPSSPGISAAATSSSTSSCGAKRKPPSAWTTEVAIRDCLGPLPATRPARRVPRGAWDTHFHVLGPQARFPYSPKRKYTPPDAPLDQAIALHDALGIDRGVVVHANTHGFDNAVDLDAVARSNGRYLAVVR